MNRANLFCAPVSEYLLLQDLDQRPNERYGQCRSLVSLKVAGCQAVTDRGASTVLQHLPNLTLFTYENTVGVISQQGKEEEQVQIEVSCTWLWKVDYGFSDVTGTVLRSRSRAFLKSV